mmetsp:Transcript_62259/g.148587  ORF Transcript_62259/g.148587 Transcript_62259/m.148587 type:complete len:335 (-) Transcript_62259:119-1123(-)|eukprot:CAMPEP_0178386788 /NCGR_PEP_ID=MMETSP0689_2-20121128/8741_1 /TAXON_ID=160604 /ORGANISM="Amphidinium massartii, Strain CS-259" /LENGTH=334 /DNA_ID=CAMNT_0020007137 /DNA_START=120 /DNA_END=1124 /DNA_ORIENTATION=-
MTDLFSPARLDSTIGSQDYQVCGGFSSLSPLAMAEAKSPDEWGPTLIMNVPSPVRSSPPPSRAPPVSTSAPIFQMPSGVESEEAVRLEKAVAQARKETTALWEAARKAALDSGSQQVLQTLATRDAELRLQVELEWEEQRRRQLWDLLRENFDNATFLIVAKNLGGGHVDVARRIFGHAEPPMSARKSSVPPSRQSSDLKGDAPYRTPRGSSVSRPVLNRSSTTATRTPSQAPDGAWRSTDSSKLGYTSTKPSAVMPTGARQMRSSLPPKPTWMTAKTYGPSSSGTNPLESCSFEPSPAPMHTTSASEVRKSSVREPSPSVQERVRAFECGGRA